MDDPSSRPTPARAPLPDAWWNLPLRTRQLIAAGVVVLLGAVVVVVAMSVSGGDGDGEDEPTEAEAFVAALPPGREATWDALAQCESEGQWDRDTGNGYFGGLQFSLVSWEGVGGFGSPAQAPREEQIMRAEMLHELQGWNAWPRCSAQLGLG